MATSAAITSTTATTQPQLRRFLAASGSSRGGITCGAAGFVRRERVGPLLPAGSPRWPVQGAVDLLRRARVESRRRGETALRGRAGARRRRSGSAGAMISVAARARDRRPPSVAASPSVASALCGGGVALARRLGLFCRAVSAASAASSAASSGCQALMGSTSLLQSSLSELPEQPNGTMGP